MHSLDFSGIRNQPPLFKSHSTEKLVPDDHDDGDGEREQREDEGVRDHLLVPLDLVEGTDFLSLQAVDFHRGRGRI